MTTEPEDLDAEVTAEEYRQLADGSEVIALLPDDFMDRLTFTDEPVDEASLPREVSRLVVRSLRLPVELEVEARKIADEQGVPVTALMREWIAAGVAQAKATVAADPVAELGRLLTAANRTYQVIAHRQEAA
jgi:hypothetical protein